MAIVKDVTLVKVDANANNNKFYRVVLHDDDSVVCYWGRVGVENPQSTTKYGGERVFNTTVRGKVRRGYKETEIQSTSTPRSNASVNKDILHKVVSTNLAKDTSPELLSALKFMVEQNRHEIVKTSGGVLKVDDSGIVKTPLGIVSENAIKDAGKVLDKISTVKSNTDKRKLTSDYLTLVPQKVIGRDWANTFFDDANKINEQRNLLRQLRSSLDWFNAQQVTSDDSSDDEDLSNFQNLFNVKLEKVSSRTKAYKEIVAKSDKTRISNHVASRLKVKNIFKLTYAAKTNKEFDEVANKLGNVKSLWHGTDSGNVLSILREGLYCPPLGDSKFKTNGRMWGTGIYLSDMFSKSANYSEGSTWGHRSSKRCFIFLVDAAMGNEYWPNRDRSFSGRYNLNNAYNGTNSEGQRFNSISVKGGTCGVMNNEMIVWDRKQVILRYLIELEK